MYVQILPTTVDSICDIRAYSSATCAIFVATGAFLTHVRATCAIFVAFRGPYFTCFSCDFFFKHVILINITITFTNNSTTKSKSNTKITQNN